MATDYWHRWVAYLRTQYSAEEAPEEDVARDLLMIYRMAKDLEALLHARRFPVALKCGRLPVTRHSCFPNELVLDRDTRGGDGFRHRPHGGPPASRELRFVRELGVAAVLRAQSRTDSPRPHEHQSEADVLVDGLFTALQEWFVDQRFDRQFEPVESRFVEADEYDIDGSPSDLVGAVYLIRFRVPRGVVAQQYNGAALADEGVLSAFDPTFQAAVGAGEFQDV